MDKSLQCWRTTMSELQFLCFSWFFCPQKDKTIVIRPRCTNKTMDDSSSATGRVQSIALNLWNIASQNGTSLHKQLRHCPQHQDDPELVWSWALFSALPLAGLKAPDVSSHDPQKASWSTQETSVVSTTVGRLEGTGRRTLTMGAQGRASGVHHLQSQFNPPGRPNCSGDFKAPHH